MNNYDYMRAKKLQHMREHQLRAKRFGPSFNPFQYQVVDPYNFSLPLDYLARGIYCPHEDIPPELQDYCKQLYTYYQQAHGQPPSKYEGAKICCVIQYYKEL